MARRDLLPYYEAVYAHCRALSGAVEGHPLGETVFRARGRVFAFLGRPDRASFTVKANREAREYLLNLPSIRRPRYLGLFGWITVTARDEQTLKLAIALVDDSYELISTRRRVGS